MRQFARAAAVAVLLATSTPIAAGAYVPSLSAAQVDSAIDAGRTAAKSHEGLSAQSYTAFATADALYARLRAGSVDAIVVGTPFQRVEYAAYLAAFEGRAVTAAAIADAATPQTIDVIVFAHSRDPLDQSFLRHFRGAILTIGTVKRSPISVSSASPAEDFFNTPAGRQLLWLGTVTYRFDLHGVDADSIAKYSVTDPYGRAYDVRIDLSKYR